MIYNKLLFIYTKYVESDDNGKHAIARFII